MSHRKKLAIENIIAGLEKFDPNVSRYYDDAEAASYYDSSLEGMLTALSQHCEDLGWIQLTKFIQKQLPVKFTAVEVLIGVGNYIIPETKRMLEVVDINPVPEENSFWDFIHPRIKSISKPRFDSGFYGDSVEAALKEVNAAVKQLVKSADGRELDGAGLMTTAFSTTNPIIKLDDLNTETGKSIQQGYMQIFAGSMTGIRNPKAHANIQPDRPRTIHLITLASLLMSKLDERQE